MSYSLQIHWKVTLHHASQVLGYTKASWEVILGELFFETEGTSVMQVRKADHDGKLLQTLLQEDADFF